MRGAGTADPHVAFLDNDHILRVPIAYGLAHLTRSLNFPGEDRNQFCFPFNGLGIGCGGYLCILSAGQVEGKGPFKGCAVTESPWRAMFSSILLVGLAPGWG